MIIATLCYPDEKFYLSKCQGSIFPSKHYCLSCVNMLGLFLTTTSFVLRIDWLKPFLTGYAITCGVNGVNSFICLWCNTAIVTIGRKVRFHHTLPFMTKRKGAVRLRRPRDCTRSSDPWFQCCHFWYFNMTSDVMFSDKFLMSCRQIWCWLGCFFPHFLSF